MSTHRGEVRELQRPPLAQANVCSKKRTACGDAKGWRSPSPTWRQRGTTSKPEEPPAETQDRPGDEMEGVRMDGPTSEAMEEYSHRVSRTAGGGEGGPRAPPTLPSYTFFLGAWRFPLFFLLVVGGPTMTG